MPVYTESRDHLHNKPMTWQSIINDCKSDIKKHKRRIAALEEAIKKAEKAIKDGIPFYTKL